MIRVSLEPGHLTAGHEARLTLLFTNAGPGTCTNIVFKVDLPPGFLLLGGRNRVDIKKLPPGREHAHELIVEAPRPGDFTVISTNFSYCDEFGVPVRVTDFRAWLSVQAAASAPGPPEPLGIEWAGGELALGEWDVLMIAVRNVTSTAVSDIVLTVSGQVRTDGSSVTVPALACGGSAEVPVPVFAADGGRHVPVTVRTTYGVPDQFGVVRRRAQDDHLLVAVRTRSPAKAVAASGVSHVQTILYLTASPKDLDLLRSTEEMRKVGELLRLGKYRDRFRLESCPAARLADIGQALADYEPQIVHFSGHGSRDGDLFVEDEMGYSEPVVSDGLASLFGLYAPTMKCVIMNACHSMRSAEAMARQIDYVVGMRSEIGDEAAILFTVGFYQGLFAGRPVQEAFRQGCALLQAKRMARPEFKTPVLITRPGA